MAISKLAAKPGVELNENFKVDPIMAKMAGLTRETLPTPVGRVAESQFEREVGLEGGVFDFDVKVAKEKSK